MRFGISLPAFADFSDPLALAELAHDAETSGWLLYPGCHVLRPHLSPHGRSVGGIGGCGTEHAKDANRDTGHTDLWPPSMEAGA